MNAAPREPRNGTNQLYPIGTVSMLTGVNPVTLRAWERRYGLVKPHRTDSGHRLYRASDVERIREILRLMDEGIPVGRIDAALRQQAAAPSGQSHPDVWTDYRERMVAAVGRFDEAGLETVYSAAMGLYPVDVVTRQLLLPLLRTLGERWANAEGSVAEEHFFSLYLRNKLGARFHHRSTHPHGPRLLAACLPGEHHEIGLLLFALAAHDRGYNVTLLGADMPLEELPLVARRTHSAAIVLAGAVAPDADVLYRRLPALTRGLRLPVFIGGGCVRECREAIEKSGAIAIGEDVTLGLRSIVEQIDATAR
ncbi:MAG: MerR family transcriptional regulator [Gammaproteobacteria bacterium]